MAESIDKAIEKLNSKLEGAVIKRLDDVSLKVKYVPSGILMLDRLCGGSGVPLGRITELFGPEGGGKTTLACLIAASWQKQGKHVAYIDMEHRMDEVWMGKLGLDAKKTYIVRPDSGTSGLRALDSMVDSDIFDLIIFDSVAAVVSESELEKDVTKQEMSIVARLMGDVIRRMNPKLSKTNTSVIFINQVRSKVGVMFGNPETTPGGRALAYFATLRFAVSKIKDKASALFDEQGKYIAHTIRVRNVKNSVGSPELEGTFMLHYGPNMKGPDNMSALIALAIEKGMIEKAGGGNYRINFNGQTFSFRGEVALIAGIRANPAILEWLISVLNLNKVYIDDILGTNTESFEQTEINQVEAKPKTK